MSIYTVPPLNKTTYSMGDSIPKTFYLNCGDMYADIEPNFDSWGLSVAQSHAAITGILNGYILESINIYYGDNSYNIENSPYFPDNTIIILASLTDFYNDKFKLTYQCARETFNGDLYYTDNTKTKLKSLSPLNFSLITPIYPDNSPAVLLPTSDLRQVTCGWVSNITDIYYYNQQIDNSPIEKYIGNGWLLPPDYNGETNHWFLTVNTTDTNGNYVKFTIYVDEIIKKYNRLFFIDKFNIKIDNLVYTDIKDKIFYIAIHTPYKGMAGIKNTAVIFFQPNKVEPFSFTYKADAKITPTCVCYTPNNAPKTINFQTTLSVKKIGKNFIAPIENSNIQVKCVLKDNQGNVVANTDFTNIQPIELSYTFTDTNLNRRNYKMELYLNSDANKVYEETIIVETSEYCNQIYKKLIGIFDNNGEDINKVPHVSSADYDDSKYSYIQIKWQFYDAYGNLMTNLNVIDSWGGVGTTDSNGIYTMTIENTTTNPLDLGLYYAGIIVSIPNGYYSDFQIESAASNIPQEFSEVVFKPTDTSITVNYNKGKTIISNWDPNTTYGGIWASSDAHFEVVETLSEGTNETKMYSYCSRIYSSKMVLQMPSYSEEEKVEIAKEIVRSLGQPRKIETYQILTNEYNLINKLVSVDGNTFPIYSAEISITNSDKTVKVKNNPSKLMKDYLSMIK